MAWMQRRRMRLRDQRQGAGRVRAGHGRAGDIAEQFARVFFPAGRQPELDLYDLSGNVWEWCRNKYDKLGDTAVDQSGDRRTWRGGSWLDAPGLARAASRLRLNPNFCHQGQIDD